MSRVGYVLGWLLMSYRAALVSMRVVYLVRKKDGEIYYGVHKMY